MSAYIHNKCKWNIEFELRMGRNELNESVWEHLCQGCSDVQRISLVRFCWTIERNRTHLC